MLLDISRFFLHTQRDYNRSFVVSTNSLKLTWRELAFRFITRKEIDKVGVKLAQDKEKPCRDIKTHLYSMSEEEHLLL